MQFAGRTANWIGWLGLLLCCAPGCVVVKVGAQNPVPGLNKVAIVPFFNLSQEPNEVVDGRRFALAYYAELQKTPGFEVLPVGIAEAAILRHQLDLRRPDDALQLCQILNADAVVVGAVTDYHPYYPPRIGLQVDWYSPYAWSGTQDGAIYLDDRYTKPKKAANCPPAKKKRDLFITRGQSPDPLLGSPDQPEFNRSGLLPELQERPDDSMSSLLGLPGSQSIPGPPAADPGGGQSSPITVDVSPVPEPTEVLKLPPIPGPEGFDPRKPLMSYTRLFDGAEQDLVNKLRDYLELRGDLRSGDWDATLQRSEDFIRFTTHIMIVEMLSLHGGAVQTQIVLKWRKYR